MFGLRFVLLHYVRKKEKDIVEKTAQRHHDFDPNILHVESKKTVSKFVYSCRNSIKSVFCCCGFTCLLFPETLREFEFQVLDRSYNRLTRERCIFII